MLPAFHADSALIDVSIIGVFDLEDISSLNEIDSLKRVMLFDLNHPKVLDGVVCKARYVTLKARSILEISAKNFPDVEDLSFSPATGQDLSFLVELSTLRHLTVDCRNMKSLTFLKGLDDITILSLKDMKQITSIADVALLTDLVELHLGLPYYVTDFPLIESLKKLRKLKVSLFRVPRESVKRFKDSMKRLLPKCDVRVSG